MNEKVTKEQQYFFDTFMEAHRRFPESRKAIDFIMIALSPTGKIIKEDIDWAKVELAKI